MSFTKLGYYTFLRIPSFCPGGAKKTPDRSESGERQRVNTPRYDKFFTAFAPGCDPSGSEPYYNILYGGRKCNRGQLSLARISEALVSGLTFSITSATTPFSSMMKVVRATPIETLP